MMPEAWLRGPLEGVLPELQPCSHALIQASEDIPAAMHGLGVEAIWATPGGAASPGFHLQHIAGSLDRLLTYAAGRQLSPEQLSAVRTEKDAGVPPRDAATMTGIALEGIRRALDVMRLTPANILHESREVGRSRLPSTVLGILFHCAEHTQRHTGQIITTAKILKGGR